jgi:hypothetical protein
MIKLKKKVNTKITESIKLTCQSHDPSHEKGQPNKNKSNIEETVIRIMRPR